ncbi:hypothetical protein D3C76_879180 [compost metagenome]
MSSICLLRYGCASCPQSDPRRLRNDRIGRDGFWKARGRLRLWGLAGNSARSGLRRKSRASIGHFRAGRKSQRHAGAARNGVNYRQSSAGARRRRLWSGGLSEPPAGSCGDVEPPLLQRTCGARG